MPRVPWHPHFLRFYYLVYTQMATIKFVPKVMAALVLKTLRRPWNTCPIFDLPTAYLYLLTQKLPFMQHLLRNVNLAAGKLSAVAFVVKRC